MSAADGPQLKPLVSDRDHAQGPADAKLTLVDGSRFDGSWDESGLLAALQAAGRE